MKLQLSYFWDVIKHHVMAPNGRKREARGKQKGNKRETKREQKGNKRETKGNQLEKSMIRIFIGPEAISLCTMES
jgi:hypothetical protein